MSRARLSETLNRLLPGERWKRVREGILEAANYSGERTDLLRQNIDEANRLKTGLLAPGELTIDSTTQATISSYAWTIDYQILQQSAAETIVISAPDANYPRPDIFVGLANGSIAYRAGSLDANGNAQDPSYNPLTEVLLATVTRNPDNSNNISQGNSNGSDYVSKSATGTETMQGNLALAPAADPNQAENYVAFDKNGKLVKKLSKTGHNKDFGTTAGTVAQGNDSRIINGQTAFSWGDHANAGYAVLGTASSQVRSNSQLDARYAAIVHNHAISDVQGLQTALDAKLNASAKGAANGVAELDSNGKVPLTQINDSLIGQVEYMGTWNPATNTPSLPTTPTEKGHYYVANAAGSRFGLSFQTGDWLISNGSSWDKVDNTDAVTSVFGRTGAVGSQVGDYAAFYPRLDTAYTNPSWIASLAWNKLTGVPSSFNPSAHTHAISEVSGLQSALDGKEAAFSKNTAFNKNFGTGSGTVAQGNDSRIINGQTAFSWGNHADAGYAVVGTGSGQVRSNSQLDGRYAAISHTHDSRYYTETEVNNFFSGASSISGYNKTNWDAAHSWGNHASVGYAVLGTGSGQVRSNSDLDVRYSSIQNSVSNWNSISTDAFRARFHTGSFQASNAPRQAVNYWSSLTFRHQLGGVYETAIYSGSTGSNPELYVRNRTNGVWGAYREIWHTGNLASPLNLTDGNAILPLNRYFGSGTGNSNTYMQMDANGAMNFNVDSGELYRFYRGGAQIASINGAGITSQGGLQTKFPNSTALGPIWRLGGKFSGSASVDHVLRVQVGNDIFDIPAELVQTIIV